MFANRYSVRGVVLTLSLAIILGGALEAYSVVRQPSKEGQRTNMRYSEENNSSDQKNRTDLNNSEHSHSQKFAGKGFNKPEEKKEVVLWREDGEEVTVEPPKKGRGTHERALARQFLEGLKGVELRCDVLNMFFGLKSEIVGITGENVHKWRTISSGDYEKAICFNYKTDQFDKLPIGDGQKDYVYAPHIIENMASPIDTIEEWFRVVRPGGYVFIVSSESAGDNGPVMQKIMKSVGREGKRSGRWNWQIVDLIKLAEQQNWKIAATLKPEAGRRESFAIVLEK